MRIFSSVQPQSEPTSPFLNIIISQKINVHSLTNQTVIILFAGEEEEGDGADQLGLASVYDNSSFDGKFFDIITMVMIF